MDQATKNAHGDTEDAMELDSPELSSEELLSKLMSALAAGARAVHGLPMDDEFEYQSSFPEVESLIKENQENLLDAIVLALSVGEDREGVNADFQGLSDPLLWEACSDVCDWLLEQAETSSAGPPLQAELAVAQKQARNSFGRLLQGVVDMDKPQDVYRLYNYDTSSTIPSKDLNSRTKPFVPSITEKHNATQAPLDLELQPGHGLEDRYGPSRPRKALPNDGLVAPSHHVPHVYQAELEALQFSETQLAAPETKPPKIQAETTPLVATWVDTPAALEDLAKHLESATEIAVDLEAHSYRSFAGITCLIQITIGSNGETENNSNYLIDPFPLWHQLQSALGPSFSNPAIVKVMHGAESDIQWLQRDFGLYIVNLFDTYFAAKALKHQRFGYANLLQTYVGFTPDKTHQLSDWRQRPLPPAMKEYAIMDTHYLLPVFRHLKYDLARHQEAQIEDVFERSRQLCMIRYAPEPFRAEGYRSLMNRRGSKTDLNETQEQVLRELWDWRDNIARQFDESLIYVCPNNGLMRLALACPTTLVALQGLLNPMPPLILRHAKQLLGLVQRCVKPPFFKPATLDVDEPTDEPNRSLMSPVLGTEALYRQAGWISPHTEDKPNSDEAIADVVTSTDEDNGDTGDSEQKPRRGLIVHEANKKYSTNQFSSHSLQLGRDGNGIEDGSTTMVDGMGPARAIHPSDTAEEAHLAQTNATNVRIAQEKHSIIALISPTTDMDTGDDEEETEITEKPAEEEFVIPRSMREIYRISNRNRRNKKSSSPVLLEPNEKEAQELAKAEEILKARALEGKNYFDDIPAIPKRQRTKSNGTASSEEAGPGQETVSREDDIALMQEIGWVKGKDEVESMLNQRGSAVEGEEEGDTGANSSDEEGMKQPKPFDYSNVGSIGAFRPPPSSNPFFAGAATSGGYLNQQFGKTEPRKKQTAGRGKQGRRQQQVERPERSQGRAQAYKKR